MPSDDLASSDAQLGLDDGSWITAMGSDDLASGDAAVARGWLMDTAMPRVTLHQVTQQ